MAVKKVVAKGKSTAQKPSEKAPTKKAGTTASKTGEKTAAKKSSTENKVKPSSAKSVRKSADETEEVSNTATETEDTNTSNQVDMIAEKKATKTKSTAAKAAPKEKKPSARAQKLAEKAAAAEPVKERRFNFKLKTFDKKITDFTVEERLQALFQLQLIDSEIDRIRIIRGELPMEVLDLEDEIAGLQTRIKNYTEEVESLQSEIANKKIAIKDSTAAIKKYESQQMNVKNNREFDSLNKEIEFQQLEIQLSEKRIKEFAGELTAKSALLEAASEALNERLDDLKVKKDELDNIIAETRKEEDQLMKFGEQARDLVDERLSVAYDRIRTNARNGLAVVTIQRDACGGCFNKIPPQRQLDIRQHKKVIVCEHCGRILVDHEIEL